MKPKIDYQPRGSVMLSRLMDYVKKARVLTHFNPFTSRIRFGCPHLLLCINVYTGCAFKCSYCYSQSYIRKHGNPRPKPHFKEHLLRDIKQARELNLNRLPVSISNSCDPMQPLEKTHQHTLYALRLLRENGFKKILLLTKNPSKILEKQYISIITPVDVSIQVTVPFIAIKSEEFEPNAPSVEARLDAVGELLKLGYSVTARVDPIIPNLGQTPDEIEQLLETLASKGVTAIISKCLRLQIKGDQDLYKRLKEFYRSNGKKYGWAYELNQGVRRETLQPVYDACKKQGIKFYTCIDKNMFPESHSCCRLGMK